MNDDGIALAENTDTTLDISDFLTSRSGSTPHIPGYLEETYWWAYLHPGRKAGRAGEASAEKGGSPAGR